MKALRGRPANVGLVPWMVAGVQTQYLHLQKELLAAGINVSAHEVQPWLAGGRIETLPLPHKTKGTIRSLLVLRQAFERRSDALWTQVALPMLPFLLTVASVRRTPVFYATDCTPKLLFEMDEHYKIADNPRSPKGMMTTALLRTYFQRCAGLLPWSQWAANSMIDGYGADPAKIHVLPPGIDTSRWRPPVRPKAEASCLRLLFVGADFERKGGPFLVDLFRRHLRDSCELHLVTRVAGTPEPGITFHTGFKPDDRRLLELYQGTDLFVLPTLADCFSISSIEAMACGLPVVTTTVGGIPEIVVDGETGYLVKPGDGRGFLEAIRSITESRELRRRLGRAARDRVERRFNASLQARRVIELMLAATSRRQALVHNDRRPVQHVAPVDRVPEGSSKAD